MADVGHIDELVAPYALGALEPDEVALVEAHLAGCAHCRQAVEEAEEVAGLLAFAAPPLTPPARVRAGLMRRLDRRLPVARRQAPGAGSTRVGGRRQADTHDQARPQPAGRSITGAWRLATGNWWARWWQPRTRAASLGAVVALGGVALVARQELQAEREQTRALAPSATKEAQISIFVLAQQSSAATLRPPDGQGPASGKLLIRPEQGQGMLVVQSLPPLGEGQVYQLWFGRDDGQQSGPLFQVTEAGTANVKVDLPDDWPIYRWLWVTVEPAGGSPAPTGPRVLDGTL